LQIDKICTFGRKIMMTACKKEDKEMPTNSVFNPYDNQASKNSK